MGRQEAMQTGISGAPPQTLDCWPQPPENHLLVTVPQIPEVMA